MAQELTDDEVFGAQGQPAPSPGEVGDDEVFGAAEDSGARMRYSVGEALKKNPDQVARTLELRTQTGMGEDLIDRNFDEVDRYARAQDTDKLRTSSPKLAKQLEDPEFAAVSRDDLENLKGWEYFVEGTKQGLQKDKQFLKRAGAALYAGVVPRANEAFYGIAQAAAETLSTAITGPLTGTLLPEDIGAKMAGKFAEVRQQNAAYAESLRSGEEGAGAIESAVYSGFESVGTNLITLPLAYATGSPGPALGTMAGSTGGREYGQARDAGVPVGNALTYATEQAAVEYLTEKLPVGRLLEDLNVNSDLVKTLTRQFVAEVPGEQLATALQDFNQWAVIDVNQGKTFKDYIEERPNAALQTFIATLVSTGVQTSSVHAVAKVQDSYSQRVAAAQAAEQTPEVFKQINQLAADSKLRERSPQAFQQFVEEAAKDGPVQDVYVDATTLRDTLQQAGVEPPAGVAAQLEEALATQGDVRIPLGEYAAQLAASPAGDALLPYIRTSPEAMSQTEAKEFLQESAEQFKGDATKALEEQQFDTARQESAKAVETELLSQLNTANRFTPEVNSAYAAMTGNFYNVQSDALGISPEEMYVKYPLRIQAESVAGGATLDQGELAANANASYNQDNPGTVGPEAEGVKSRIETALAQSKTGTIEEADYGQIEQRQQTQPNIGDLPAGDPKLDDSGLAPNDDRGTASRDQAADRSETSPRAVRQAVEDFAVQGLNAPAFKRFMQGAFFVTPDGAPVVFYHGSQNAGKTTFDESRLGGSTGAAESGLGFFITGSKTGANLYAKNKRNASKQGTRYETVTNVKNPYIVESLRDFKGATTLEDFRGIRASLEAAGYDSIYSKSNRWVVTFNPEAIKSLRSTDIATGKSLRVARGTFGAEDARVFYQPGEGQDNQPASTRGSISFAPDITKAPSIISLLQKADLTTFLHESGHFYLEVLSDISSQENAPPRIAEDMQKILDWFGVKDPATWRGMSLEEKRPYHEQFARGFEAYLFEGKSPSLALNKIFARFRAWMMSVYRSMQALNVELTPEVRGVFDRLLATSEQIQEAQEARAYAPLFTTKPEGMAIAEWESYQNAHADATQEAVETLQKRSLRDMQWLQNARSGKLKELQKAANQKRAAVHREVVEEVKAQPVYAVQNFMRKGDLPGFEGGKGAKLSLPAIRELIESGTPSQRAEIAKFTSGFSDLLTETDGIHPDELAGMFGFTSGDHLIQAITSAEPEQSAIDGMVDQRMLEKYGDLNSPQELAKAANAAIHNEARGKFIAAELQALNKATGQKKLLVKAAKEFADQIIARKKIRDVQPARYEAAESRAARNALKAYTKGKGGLTEAATEKRNQIVNHYAARAAYDALDTVDKGVRYLGKFDVAGSRKNLDPEYLDQIDALLDRFNLSKSQSLRNIDKAKTLAEWITSQEEQGLSPVIPDELRNEAFRKHYKDMAVEEFQGLIDSVKNIEHLGRLKKKLLTAVDQREFEAAVDEIRDSIEDNAKRTVPERRTSDRGLLVDAGKLFRSFVAEHRKFASLVQELDGFEDGGPAWEYLVRTLNTSGDFEAVENEQATIALEALFKPVFGKKALRAKTYFPTIGKSFTYEERLGIALNVGNEANRERILSGELLSPQQLDTILDTLTAPDWTLVQGVWDYLESFRPQIAAKERRVTGVEPKWVEAAPVRTKFGELKGGYYPIKYDAERSSRSEADIAAEVQRQTMQGLYTRAQTRRGHLKARSSEPTGRPVRYDLGVVFEHVSQVIHDLAWHEYLIDANRLLKDPAVDASIRAHYGPEKLRAMTTALDAVAKGQIGPQSSFGVGMNHVRFGATISGLGWKLSTALLQPLGLTQSMSRIGVKWVAKGAAHWLGDAAHLENSIRIVGEKSAFMRLRAKTMQREINEIRNKVSGKDSRIQASYFWLIQKMQLVADMPTWWGRYEKAMSEADMTEEKAIALADQAVVDAQGSGQIKDLSGIERGSEGQKLFTVFYSFFNTTFNLTARAAGRTNFKSPTSVALFAADMALLYAIPATLGMILKQALKGEWEEPEEALAGLASQLPSELAGYVMGTMVGLRELSATARALSGQSSSYTGPAAIRLFSELQKVGVQSEQGDADASFWKALNNVGGIFFHYPSGQINQTAEGLAAMLNGDTENPLVLISGPK